MYQKINNEHDSNTVPDTSGINKEKESNQNEPPISEMDTPHNQTTHNLTSQNKH